MYHGGIIVVEFAAFTQEAENAIKDLLTLRLTINEDTMLNAWNQVESEKQEPFGHSGFETIIAELKELDNLSWQTFDKLDVINLNDVRRQSKPFYISTGKLKRTKSLFIDFYLDTTTVQKKQQLLPLANRLLSVIGLNTQYFLTREMGIYFDDEIMHYDKKSLTYRLKFKTYPELEFSDDELGDAISYVIKELYEGGAFERLCTELQSIPQSLEYWIGPSINWVYDSSYQVVGAKGWKRLATEDNVRELLYGIHVNARFGTRHIELLHDSNRI
jgi:hypothetical protein